MDRYRAYATLRKRIERDSTADRAMTEAFLTGLALLEDLHNQIGGIHFQLERIASALESRA